MAIRSSPNPSVRSAPAPPPTRAVFTGQFDTAYKADIKSTYEPPLQGMKESTSVLDAKWLGACKPGQKAGDISMPGMPNMNMNDMMKKLPKQP